MPVNSTHLDYDANAAAWLRARDVFAGEDAVKEGDVLYLPRLDHHERLMEDHKQARDAYQESLQGIVAEQSAANAKLMVCLDNNTAVLEECRDELRYARTERSRT